MSLSKLEQMALYRNYLSSRLRQTAESIAHRLTALQPGSARRILSGHDPDDDAMSGHVNAGSGRPGREYRPGAPV